MSPVVATKRKSPFHPTAVTAFMADQIDPKPGEPLLDLRQQPRRVTPSG
jgi:hypothetical protein